MTKVRGFSNQEVEDAIRHYRQSWKGVDLPGLAAKESFDLFCEVRLLRGAVSLYRELLDWDGTDFPSGERVYWVERTADLERLARGLLACLEGSMSEETRDATFELAREFGFLKEKKTPLTPHCDSCGVDPSKEQTTGCEDSDGCGYWRRFLDWHEKQYGTREPQQDYVSLRS